MALKFCMGARAKLTAFWLAVGFAMLPSRAERARLKVSTSAGSAAGGSNRTGDPPSSIMASVSTMSCMVISFSMPTTGSLADAVGVESSAPPSSDGPSSETPETES